MSGKKGKGQSKTFALIGNPNCGKTTLFNALTGARQKIGNWPGVTVEKKEGAFKKDKSVKIIDLPGTYSFDASSPDEAVIVDFLKKTPPDCVINVIDGTNLERNLYLTSLLSSFNVPTVLAVNFADELEKNGVSLDEKIIGEAFGVPALKISALKNKNVNELIALALSNRQIPHALNNTASGRNIPQRLAYALIESLVKSAIKNNRFSSEKFTLKADRILTGKFTGIPIFALIIVLVYFLSFKLGKFPGEEISRFFVTAEKNGFNYLLAVGVPEALCNLFTGAVIRGIGTALSFLPQILILFALLALLEESGYMARVSFISDRFFRTFGLGGKSVIPLVLSCGCNVTGIMAARTVEPSCERKMTIFISPFMPCGAKCAVFGWFSYEFFGESALVAASLYFLGIIVAAVAGRTLKKFKSFRGKSSDFLLEIPPLRRPTAKNTFFVLYEKTKDFLVKSGTVIFLVSVVLWLLKSFGTSGYVGSATEKSFLYTIGNALKFLFYPLGFGDWRASVAVITGLFAKEAVIETAELIGGDYSTYFSGLFSVYAFMAFVLLSPPCAASLIAAKRELKSNKDFAFMLIFQFLTAYVVALIINLTGLLFSDFNRLIFPVIIGIIILIGFSTALSGVFRGVKGGCHNCFGCKKGEVCPKK